MARWFSKGIPGRGAFRGGALYLAGVVVVFAVAVFLLFRGHSPGSQEAVAGDLSVGQDSVASASAAGMTETRQESPAAQPTPPPALPQASAPVQTSAPGQPADTSNPWVETASAGNAEAQSALAEALALAHAQPAQVIAARNRLNRVLLMPLTSEQRATVKDEMAKLANDWLFGPAAFPGDTLCDTYAVKRGDLMEVIGRRFKVPYEFLMQINSIPRPQALQAGRALKVVRGPFHAKVYRSKFLLDLYLQDTYVRSFKVGLGKPGYETPLGLWRVHEGGKLVKPTWTDPDSGRVYKASDPDYPLGSRWIALDGISGAAKGRTGFAIHGTKDPEQIGTAGSRGCIRMYNGEVVLMYNLLVPLYSQVEVLE